MAGAHCRGHVSSFVPSARGRLLVTGPIPAEHRLDPVQPVPEQEPAPLGPRGGADAARPLLPPGAPRRRGPLGHLLGPIPPHRWLRRAHRPGGGHWGPAQAG